MPSSKARRKVKFTGAMNIGINTLFHIPGQVGGTETYLLELLKGFEAAQSQHSFTLFTQQDNDELLRQHLQSQRCEFVRLNFAAENRYVRILREQTELPWHLRRRQIDVLWSPGYTLPLLCPCPQVVTIHDMQYKTFPEDLAPLARVATDFLVQTAARRADQIIAVSEFSRRELLLHTGVKPAKLHVIHEAAANDFGTELSDSADTATTPFILCVANTYPHKNIAQLVRVFCMIQDQVPHQLVLVGRPRLGDDLVQQALAKLREPKRCVRKQGLQKAELARLYRQCALFAFPSQYEGFGLPVLEALSAGTPVVTTRCGSLPEVGADAVTYYDHLRDDDLADKMLMVLHRSREERARWRAAGLARAAEFSWSKAARETLAVFELCRNGS